MERYVGEGIKDPVRRPGAVTVRISSSRRRSLEFPVAGRRGSDILRAWSTDGLVHRKTRHNDRPRCVPPDPVRRDTSCVSGESLNPGEKNSPIRGRPPEIPVARRHRTAYVILARHYTRALVYATLAGMYAFLMTGRERYAYPDVSCILVLLVDYRALKVIRPSFPSGSGGSKGSPFARGGTIRDGR